MSEFESQNVDLLAEIEKEEKLIEEVDDVMCLSISFFLISFPRLPFWIEVEK